MVRRRIGLGLFLAGALGSSAALAAPQVAGQSQNQDLRLDAEIEPARVYVQAQAIYRLRFYQAIDVSDLKMIGPSTRLADLRPIGTERIYEALRNGRRYRVHERSYAVFPFGSGALELAGAHATGRVAAVAAKSADGRQAVRLEAAAQILTVRPVPTAAGTTPWLPAHSLTLTESWSPPAAQVRPGQAQRRTIRIEAAGIDAGQIPPLQIAAPGMMVDAEPPRLENRMAGERNIGVREQTFRMVALRAGELLVPALQLRWWNLNADALASATLPARTLRVAAIDAKADTVPANILPMPAAAAAAAEMPQPAPKLSLLLAGAILLSVGIALAYVWRRPGVRAAWRLQRACRLGTAAAVRGGLLAWAGAIWPEAPPLTLEALGERLPGPATHIALGIIDRSLYGPQSGPSDAAALEAAVRVVKRAIRPWKLLHR